MLLITIIFILITIGGTYKDKIVCKMFDNNLITKKMCNTLNDFFTVEYLSFRKILTFFFHSKKNNNIFLLHLRVLRCIKIKILNVWLITIFKF